MACQEGSAATPGRGGGSTGQAAPFHPNGLPTPRGWAACVSDHVLEAYDGLPRTGKARGDGSEWSALAAFLVSMSAPGTPGLRVVALGTGTKCVGASQRSARGDVVHDCHAEVVARRAFTCYLHHQLCAAAAAHDGDDTLIVERQHDGRFALKAGVYVHMYCSHTPCGDCCLGDDDSDGGSLGRRTGAKLVGDRPLADGTWREAAGGWQQAGMARRKPGRGELTLSVSCSDKLARWTVLGLQGACLLHFFAAPLYLATVTVATDEGRQIEGALQRSLVRRLDPLREVFAGTQWQPHPPEVHVALPSGRRELEAPQSSEHGDGAGRGPSSCGASLNWFAGAPAEGHGGVEVVTGTTGKKAGATKRTMDGQKTSSRLCRASSLARFRHLLALLAQQRSETQKLGGATYAAVKAAAPGGYGAARAALLASPESPLHPWIAKPAGEQEFG